jgi:hypothetical protein
LQKARKKIKGDWNKKTSRLDESGVATNEPASRIEVRVAESLKQDWNKETSRLDESGVATNKPASWIEVRVAESLKEDWNKETSRLDESGVANKETASGIEMRVVVCSNSLFTVLYIRRYITRFTLHLISSVLITIFITKIYHGTD